jgi:undecaprenyl-diphosphatase
MISQKTLKKGLKQIDFVADYVRPVNADARGSVPFIAASGKKKVFIKVVSRRSAIADLLFKLWRRVIFRRLEDEVPFISPKQALEHEAYIGSLAYEAGIRTPRSLGVITLRKYRFGLVQEQISDSRTLDKVASSRLNLKVLRRIWREVDKLHEAKIAHRDLRAANILLDKDDWPWLIDFDFASAPATPRTLRSDSVELLASLSILCEPKLVVRAASSFINPAEFKRILPLLQYRRLTSATRQEMYKTPDLLSHLHQEVKKHIKKSKK